MLSSSSSCRRPWNPSHQPRKPSPSPSSPSPYGNPNQVQTAFALHDTDGNTTIEADEFLGFVRGNAFLSVWFGFLADGPEKTSSWREAHLA